MVRRFFFEYHQFLFFVATTIVVATVSLFDSSFSDAIFLKTGYFLMLGLFMVWVYSVWNLGHSESIDYRSWIFDHALALATIAIVCFFAFFAIEPGFRVLSDETNLISVSRSMFYDQKIYNTLMGKWYFNNFYPITEELPTRPLMYPFLTSIVHSLTGYRFSNAFYTNGILGFLFLGSVYGMVSLYLGQVIGVASVFLILAQPLFGLSMTSGGYEICNLLFLWFLCFATGMLVRSPTQPRFHLWWFTGIMFSHVRYENPLLFALIALVVAWDWKRVWPIVQASSGAVGLGMFFLLPCLWQTLYADGNYENGEKALLSLSRVPQKISALLTGMFDFSFVYPYATIVNIFVVVSIMVALLRFQYLWHFFKVRRGLASGLSALFMGSFIATLISASHFLADPLHPAVFRLFLPTIAFFSLLATLCTVTMSQSSRVKSLLFAVVAILVYVPVAARKSSTNSLTLIRATNAVYDYLDQLKDPRVLLVVDRPGQYTVRNNGAVDFDYANRNVEQLQADLNRQLISKILVVQEVEYAGNKPRLALDGKFKLAPIWEIQQDSQIKVVVSQVAPN